MVIAHSTLEVDDREAEYASSYGSEAVTVTASSSEQGGSNTSFGNEEVITG